MAHRTQKIWSSRGALRRWVAALALLLGTSLAAVEAREADEAGSDRPGEGTATAIVVERDTVLREQVVALGRDLEMRGECRAGAAVLGGDARISGRIEGDLVVLGGSVRLDEGARVDGDVYAFGGSITAVDGSVAGRSVAYPTAPSTWLLLLEGPTVGLDPFSPTVLAAKLALVLAWLVVTVVLLGTGGHAMLRTAAVVRAEGTRSFFVGLVAVLAAVLTVVFFSAFLGALVGVPMVVLVVLVALLFKIWGTVAVFVGFGQWLLERLGRRRELALTAALVGLLTLGVFKFVPFVGSWVWTVITLVGVGASLASKFGRLEPWWTPLDSR
jgi:hypothetical protein